MIGLGSNIASHSVKYSGGFKNQDFLAFDGTNDKIVLTSASLMTRLHAGNMHTSGTLMCWFQMTDAVSANSMIIDLTCDASNRIYILYKQSDDTLSCTYRGNGTSRICTIDKDGTLEGDDTWHHVAMTWDTTGNAIAYFDGDVKTASKSISSYAFSGADFSTAGASITAGESYSGGSDWQGYIDEVALFTSVLSSDEINEIWNEGVVMNISDKTNLQAYWRFEESEGSTVYDEIAGYEGTITGAAWGSETLSVDDQDTSSYLF